MAVVKEQIKTQLQAMYLEAGTKETAADSIEYLSDTMAGIIQSAILSATVSSLPILANSAGAVAGTITNTIS